MTNTIPQTASPAEVARSIRCPLCWTLPGNGPCQRQPAGDHLARLIAAVKAGLLSKAELTEVVGGIEVIADHVVILERAA